MKASEKEPNWINKRQNKEIKKMQKSEAGIESNNAKRKWKLWNNSKKKAHRNSATWDSMTDQQDSHKGGTAPCSPPHSETFALIFWLTINSWTLYCVSPSSKPATNWVEALKISLQLRLLIQLQGFTTQDIQVFACCLDAVYTRPYQCG